MKETTKPSSFLRHPEVLSLPRFSTFLALLSRKACARYAAVPLTTALSDYRLPPHCPRMLIPYRPLEGDGSEMGEVSKTVAEHHVQVLQLRALR